MARRPRAVPAIVSRVRADRLSYLEEAALVSLHDAVARCEVHEVPGCVIEAGCASGGSAIVMAAAKSSDRPMFIYDVFGTIPAPGPQDGADVHERYDVIARGLAQGIDGAPYYGYSEDLRAEVVSNFARLGLPMDRNSITAISGSFEDTLHPPGQVAIAHIDGDWYASVRVALERILPAMAPGAVVVVDDYFAWSGCFDAVNDMCRDLDGNYRIQRWRHPRLRIVRTS